MRVRYQIGLDLLVSRVLCSLALQLRARFEELVQIRYLLLESRYLLCQWECLVHFVRLRV